MVKQIILMIAYVVINNIAYAQTWQWAKSGGGALREKGRSITTDLSGNVYVAGSFASDTLFLGNTSLINSGNIDCFLIKYDVNGTLLWAQEVGGLENDEFTTVITDAMGNIYVAGYFKSSTFILGVDSLSSAADSMKAFIVKYDALGNILWAKQANGVYSSAINSLAKDANGQIYMTGFYTGTLQFGNNMVTSIGGKDIFIAKFDSSGIINWVKSAGGMSDDIGNGITMYGNRVYITGRFDSNTAAFGNSTINSAGSTGVVGDIFLAAYDTSGNVQWANSAGGQDYDAANAITIDGTGNIYITGEFDSPVILFSNVSLINASGGQKPNMFLAKYDSSGKLIWLKQAEGSFVSNSFPGIVGYGIAEYSDQIYVTGEYGGIINIGDNTLHDPFSGACISYSFLATYDSDDYPCCALSSYTNLNPASGHSSIQSGYSIVVSSEGYLYVTGSFSTKNMILGNLILNNIDPTGTSEDFFVAQRKIRFKESMSFPFTIYPNPTREILNVEKGNNSCNDTITIELFTILGQIIFLKEYLGANAIIPINNLAAGIYILKVQSKNVTYVEKILKE